MKPINGIEYVGKFWLEKVNEIHNIDGVDCSDGKGAYLMGLRTDCINSLFDFNINKQTKLTYFRQTIIQHIFNTPKYIEISTNSETLRLFNQMVYFYAKTSLFINNAKRHGLLIEMLLDSSERVAFTFVESFLEGVGIDYLLLEGYSKPFLDVDPKRLQCLLSAKIENNEITYCSSNIKVRLEKYIQNIRNDNTYRNTEEYNSIIKRYIKAYNEIRHLLMHSGYYRSDNSEIIVERKYTEVNELITLILELCKIIWNEVYKSEIPYYFYEFSLDKLIDKVAFDIQHEIDIYENIRKYEYYKPTEPRYRQL